MSSSFSLYARLLERPFLRFDYALPTAKHKSPLGGLSNYGPYDKNLFPKPSVRFAILYPKSSVQQVDNFLNALRNGIGPYPGFRDWFRVEIEDIRKLELPSLDLKSYERSICELVKGNYDLNPAIKLDFT